MIILPIPPRITYTFLFKRDWDDVLFKLGSEKVNKSSSIGQFSEAETKIAHDTKPRVILTCRPRKATRPGTTPEQKSAACS